MICLVIVEHQRHLTMRRIVAYDVEGLIYFKYQLIHNVSQMKDEVEIPFLEMFDHFCIQPVPDFRSFLYSCPLGKLDDRGIVEVTAPGHRPVDPYGLTEVPV